LELIYILFKFNVDDVTDVIVSSIQPTTLDGISRRVDEDSIVQNKSQLPYK